MRARRTFSLARRARGDILATRCPGRPPEPPLTTVTSRSPRRAHSARRWPIASRAWAGGGNVVDLGVGGEGGQTAVGLEAEVLSAHVALRQVGGDGQVQADLRWRAESFALELGYRLAHHLDVQVIADRRDVTGLVGAQEVAGTPDLQVPHGDLETGPQLGVLTDGAQPLVGLLGELAVRRVEK